MSVLILKQLKSGQNTGPHALECYKPENKIFRDFQVFVLCPIPNNENSEIPKIHQKPPKYWNVSMQFQKLFKYCSNDINLKMVQIYIHQIGFKQLSRWWFLKFCQKIFIQIYDFSDFLADLY